MEIKPNRVELELLAIELFKFDKGTNRQWAGIDEAERIRYRTTATDLLLEDSYATTEPVVEVVGADLTIKDNGFEGVLVTRKRGRPAKPQTATGPKIVHG